MFYFTSSLSAVASFCSFWKGPQRILALWVFSNRSPWFSFLKTQAAGHSGSPPEQIMTWYFNIHSEHCLFPWAVRHMALQKSNSNQIRLEQVNVKTFQGMWACFSTSINLIAPLSVVSAQGQQAKLPHSGTDLTQGRGFIVTVSFLDTQNTPQAKVTAITTSNEERI